MRRIEVNKNWIILVPIWIGAAGCQPLGQPVGAMLPGALYTQEGRVINFAIQKMPRSGAVTAFDPATQENFSGSYVGVLESVSENSSAYVTNGTQGAVGVENSSIGSNIANATAYLQGDKGTMINCQMQIEAGIDPHGLGTCTDNHGQSYRLQF